MNNMTAEQPSPQPTESPSGPESSPKPVFEVFQKGLQYYEKSILDLKGKADKDPASLSQDEKRRLSDFDVCIKGSQNVKGEGKIIPVETMAGTSHEGIPVEGMIEALHEQIQKRETSLTGLHDEVQDRVTEEILEIRQILNTIEGNSKFFRQARIEEGLTDPAFFTERTKAEAKFTSEDKLRQSENPDSQTKMEEDWFNAEKTLERRRELILPTQTETGEKPTEINEVLTKLENLTGKKEPAVPDLNERYRQSQKKEEPTPPLTAEAPAKEVEEIDPSYFDSGTRHEHPFLEDIIDDPSSPRLKDLKDNLEKKHKGELYANQEVVDNMDIVEKLLKDEGLKTLFPKKDNETDVSYRTRTLQNLMGRLRFHGDYQTKKDPLYAYLQQNLKDTQGRPYHWDEVLIGAEGLNALDIQTRNEAKTKEYDQYMYNLNQSARRRSVLTEVDLVGDERYPGGGLQPYLTKDAEGKTVREKMPQADLAAFEVVGTVLMDIQDPTLGKNLDGRGYTYSEVFKHQQEIVLNTTSTQEQKDNASKRLASLRESFYVKTLDVLKHRESHNPYREGEEQSAFSQKSFARLQELTANKTPDQAQEALIAAYKTSYEAYHGRPLTAVQEARVKNIISTPEQPGITQDIMDLAIKGGEFMRRRVEKLKEPQQLEKVPPRIFRKKFKEAGVYRGPVYEEEAPVTITPPEKEEEGGTPESAPSGEDGEKEPGKDGESPEGAPVSEGPVPPPELAKEFNVAAVADKSRIEQEIGGLAQHDRSRDKPARGFIRSILTPITNPREFIRNVVQNTFFKGTFDARSMSFSRSMMEVAREKHAGLDSSIPFEMPQDILDKAVTEGRQVRKKDNVLKRIGYTFYDVGSGLTGLYQNSDMIYARKWFEENGKSLVDQAKNTSLAEQTQLGEKYALEGKNEDIISKDLGETRYRLDELITDENVKKGFQGKIKELIGKYATKQLNDEELLKEFNLYYHKEVLPKIPADKQKELEGIEVSSNIIRIGHEMLIEDTMTTGEKKTRYQRYQDETTEDGKKKWDELELRIYLGQGKYETARGEVRLSGLEKKLIHRMVERDYKLSNGLVLNSAVETLKDIGIYGGAYLAGGAGAALMAGRMAFPIGGLVTVPLMAGGREGILVSRKGKLFGIRGKSVTDFEQVSRELAQGRASMDKAKLRPMFEKALVDQRSAGELTSPIINLLNKESLNADEQKKLMMEIAHAKARLKLSDLSTQKGKGFLQVSVAQNFVGYTEGKQNQEMTALRAAIVQGVSKLSQSNPQLYGKVQQAQAVYEAQLKVGSVQNKLGRVVSVDTGLSQADAQNIVTEFYSDLGIDTTAGKSLEKAAFTLAKVVDGRAAKTAAFAAIVSPIIGAELKLIQMPFAEMAAIHNEGFSGWSADWHQVLSGDVPLKIDNNGQLISDLSAAQKATLWTHNTIFEPPPGTPHDTMIDGVKIQLPGTVEHGHVAGDTNSDALVDIRSGKVLVDMSQTKLALNDFNGDGKLEMVLTNNSGQVLTGAGMDAGQTLIQEFNKAGIKLIQDPALNEPTSTTETVFQAGAITSKGVDLNHDGTVDVKTNIPANTNWQFDNTTGKWDLHGTNVNGTDRILINDANIGSNGQITGGVYDHSIITVNNSLIAPSGESGTTINVEPPASGGEIWGSAADYRVVHAPTEPQAINNFVESTGDKAHPWEVTFRWHDKIIQNPNTGADINVSQANQAGQVGMLLQIPHFGDHGQDVAVFIPAHQATDGGYEVHFDPTDTRTMIQLPDGHSASMADISRAFLNNGELTKYVEQHGVGSLGSELTYEGRAAFNLANPDGLIEHQGRILAGVLDPTSNNYGHDAYNGAFLATHAVHGSEAVNLEGPLGPPEPGYTPTIDVGNITDKIDTTILGYKIGPVPVSGIGIPVFPVPMRENVEKSVRGDAGTPATTTQTTTTTTTVPPTPEKEKEKPRDELEEIAEPEKIELNEKLKTKKQELQALNEVINQNLSKDKKKDEEARKILEEEIAGLEARINVPETKVQIKNSYEKFREMKKEGQVEVSSTFFTGGKFFWQEVTYGQERQKSGDDCYRGYLMIEPQDFPQALGILSKIGEDRKKNGKRLDFKWLTRTLDPVEPLLNEKIGNYKDLKPTDPRIVIYGDDAAEVQEILSSLAENPDWEKIEENRIETAGGKPENAPRRPGTNAFLFQGKELRSLNWNDKAGYSENEAADPDWRKEKIGDKTVLIDNH